MSNKELMDAIQFQFATMAIELGDRVSKLEKGVVPKRRRKSSTDEESTPPPQPHGAEAGKDGVHRNSISEQEEDDGISSPSPPKSVLKLKHRHKKAKRCIGVDKLEDLFSDDRDTLNVSRYADDRPSRSILKLPDINATTASVLQYPHHV